MENNVQGNSCGFKEVTVEAKESGTIQSCEYADMTVRHSHRLPQSYLPTFECSQVASSPHSCLLRTSDYLRTDHILLHKAGSKIPSK